MVMKRKRPTVVRAMVEIGFIVFLFYSNLLMGEFERSNQAGKTLTQGFWDIWTMHNFEIAMVSSLVGFVVFEALREQTGEVGK